MARESDRHRDRRGRVVAFKVLAIGCVLYWFGRVPEGHWGRVWARPFVWEETLS